MNNPVHLQVPRVHIHSNNLASFRFRQYESKLLRGVVFLQATAKFFGSHLLDRFGRARRGMSVRG